MDDKKYMRLDLDDTTAKLHVGYCGVQIDKVQLVLALGVGFVRMYDLVQKHRRTAAISIKNSKESLTLLVDLLKNSEGSDHIYGQIKFFKEDLIIDLTDPVHELPIGKDKVTGTIVTDDVLGLLNKVKRT